MATPIPAPKVVFIFQKRVTFKPEDRATFLKYFMPVYDKVIAEPECAYFFVGESIQEPGVYQWTEGWTKDVNWFKKVGGGF